jgi:3-deoxy-D-manno-octulosonic-acid transferase
VRGWIRPFYHGAIGAARAASALAPAGGGKLQQTFHARRMALASLQRQAAQQRQAGQPLAWFHAPSVGEGLQARPVAQALRAMRPDVQQAYTHFSPSAERLAASLGADVTGYLPWDGVAEAEALLTALRPSVLAFVKLDVWPQLVERATRRRRPVVLLSATLSPRSGRQGWWARQLLGDAYRALAGVGAIDARDAERLVALGVRRDVIRVTGDTGFDQAWERSRRANRGSPLLAPLADGRPTVVAGSTWPADEAVLLPAWAQLRKAVPDARLVIAPHEPTPAHVAPVLAWAQQAGVRAHTLADVEAGGSALAADTDVVVVDRVGVLWELYALATAAYVGGGFHAAGLHSVIEPAVFGAPVVVGPRHHTSREAGLLLAGGGAVVAADQGALAATLRQWLTDADTRLAAGLAATALVEAERGATQRTLALLTPFLPG